ncbi:uncharacterized protein A1O5_12952 [Cladophialophora psammophila CBS 110553]|uniref:Uncharacterized protein n=1 Tax=Cladophialophora psammophila CBS 110553 TaxID=1182543 RepID=W9VRW9_9EURO|nr:uncharacterized protein A1O5_12952 [Cladophialophora psammophila CBS 110553]EXJ54886.1 hypothetical protein A1O5_12952 [Cladophialophora psammophila CBS 110553]
MQDATGSKSPAAAWVAVAASAMQEASFQARKLMREPTLEERLEPQGPSLRWTQPFQGVFVPENATELPIEIPTHRVYRRPPLAITWSATTTKGDAPNATNIAKDNPKSASPQDKSTRGSKATGDGPQDTSSIEHPTEQGSVHGGRDEAQDADSVKRDPKKPAEQKRREVEKQGQKPLDPADK